MRHAAGVNGEALDNLLDGLRDAVEGEGQGLDVLGCSSGGGQTSVQASSSVISVADAPCGWRTDEVVEVGGRAAGGRAHGGSHGEEIDAGLGLLGTRLQQVEEFVLFAEDLLSHEIIGVLFWVSGEVWVCEAKPAMKNLTAIDANEHELGKTPGLVCLDSRKFGSIRVKSQILPLQFRPGGPQSLTNRPGALLQPGQVGNSQSPALELAAGPGEEIRRAGEQA